MSRNQEFLNVILKGIKPLFRLGKEGRSGGWNVTEEDLHRGQDRDLVAHRGGGQVWVYKNQRSIWGWRRHWARSSLPFLK